MIRATKVPDIKNVEHNVDQVISSEANQLMHSKNRNLKTNMIYKFLQINKANSDFKNEMNEILEVIEKNNSDFTKSKVATETNNTEEKRLYKNKKNIHNRKVKTEIKKYYKQELEHFKGRWKSIKEKNMDEDLSPTEI